MSVGRAVAGLSKLGSCNLTFHAEGKFHESKYSLPAALSGIFPVAARNSLPYRKLGAKPLI
jgi:hypothetical protein